MSAVTGDAATGDPSAFFVYGTLKRGEINHSLLALHAASIEAGWVRGLLYDVGDFPALVEGDGRVYGELVQIHPPAMSRLLIDVDRLEQYVPGDETSSLYRRRVVDVTTAGDRVEHAYAYFYTPSHPALLPLEALRPLPAGRWSASDHPEGPTEHEALEEYRAWVRTYSASAES